MFEKGDSQMNNKNEWLLRSASFTAKFEFVFVTGKRFFLEALL